MHRLLVLSALLVALARPATAEVTIDWVPVGNAGNAADTPSLNCLAASCGSVSYAYLISKYEVTNAQYAEFLNAVAATDTYTLYNTGMASDAFGGITRSGSSGSYSYAVKSGQGSNPVVYVSWYDTLRFANWLHNGQPRGAQGPTTTEGGAYTFSGATTVGGRNVGALTFLPTENEWYKAAYYDATSASFFDYPTGSNTAPSSDVPPGGANSANFYDGTFALTGSEFFVSSFNYLTDVGAYAGSGSPYGTFDQGGNVSEWNETVDGLGRGIRGGNWGNYASDLAALYPYVRGPTSEVNSFGFRVASPIPEPDCNDGLDNDGDGLTDLDDPGCADASDVDEHSPTLPCDDGGDNDGDTKADYLALGGGDPACYNVLSPRENPQCQDGLNNDGETGIDFDGGISLDIDPQDGFIDIEFNPDTPAVGAADPQCVGSPWKNKEKAATGGGGGGCGLGFELVFLAPLLARLARKRRA